HRFSSASRAAGDSPCSSSPTGQWVVVNATAPFSVLALIVLSQAPLSLGLTLRSSKKSRAKSKHQTQGAAIAGSQGQKGEIGNRPSFNLRRKNSRERHLAVDGLLKNIVNCGADFRSI